MKILFLFALFGFSVVANSQTPTETTTLTGHVYDANGSVIVNATVSAIDQKKQKFETRTNADGLYKLKLPFSPYVSSDHKFNVAKYDVSVIADFFERSVLNNFKVVRGNMQLDVALDVLVIVNPIEVEDKNIVKNKDKGKEEN